MSVQFSPKQCLSNRYIYDATVTVARILLLWFCTRAVIRLKSTNMMLGLSETDHTS